MDDRDYVEVYGDSRDMDLTHVESSLKSTIAHADAILNREGDWLDDMHALTHDLHRMVDVAQAAKDYAHRALASHQTVQALQRSIARRS